MSNFIEADAVIFDKDGTLLDFDAFWVTVSVKALNEVLLYFDKPVAFIGEILESLGVHDGITDIDGILCKGTYGQIGQIVYDVLSRYGCAASYDDVTDVVINAYNRNSDSGEIKATCPDLADVLKQLKQQGKKLAVITTDNENITYKCLKELGIETLFDKVYTDDGSTPAKPDPYCAIDFCRSVGVKEARTVMVGDTMTDVSFAKNAGIQVIAVAKGEGNKAILSQATDVVIPSLSALVDVLK